MSEEKLDLCGCLIACNEERDIGDAVASLDFCREIVIVLDTKTTDRTEEVAQETAAPGQVLRVVRRDWQGHVAQKNLALDEAEGFEWVLCLDADERVSPQLREEILQLFKGSPPPGNAYSCPRRTFYLGRWIGHGGWYPDRKIRLFRRALGRWGGTDPHDHVEIEGRIGTFGGDLLHYTYENVADHIDKIDQYTTVASTRMHERGVRFPVLRMWTHPPGKFFKMYVLQRGFLDGYAGFVLAVLGAFYVFLKYAKLWEKSRAHRIARSHGAVRPDSL